MADAEVEDLEAIVVDLVVTEAEAEEALVEIVEEAEVALEAAEADLIEAEIGVAVLEAQEVDFQADLEKCTKQYVLTVSRNARFLSSQHKASLFIAGNALLITEIEQGLINLFLNN